MVPTGNDTPQKKRGTIRLSGYRYRQTPVSKINNSPRRPDICGTYMASMNVLLIPFDTKIWRFYNQGKRKRFKNNMYTNDLHRLQYKFTFIYEIINVHRAVVFMEAKKAR